MKREEAIKTLNELLRETNDPWYEGVYNMAIEALKEQKISNELQEYAYECGYEHFFPECQNCEHRRIGNKTQDWIPCSEGLPSDGDNVFVTVIDDHGDTPWRYTDIAWLCNGTWIADNEILLDDVIAWMPRPKPYKGGNTE